MKVKYSMISHDLRLPGRFFKIFCYCNFTLFKQFPGRYGNPYRLLRKDNSVIRMLVRRPRGVSEKVPGLLWIHGGGYCTGMPEMIYMSMAKQAAKKCVIVAPSYTLSAVKPYPAALEDCYDALEWMLKHADRLGIRTDQIFVGGESAGGGLTVALCMFVRDNSNIKIACQMPLYPMLDDRMNTASMKDNNAPVWSEKQNKKAWESYLRDVDKENVPVYAAPSRATDYSGLPPAFSFVGGVEPFLDETVQYFEDLKKAGIKASLKVFDGCYHSFDIMVPFSDDAKRAREFFNEELDKAVNSCFAPQNDSENK